MRDTPRHAIDRALWPVVSHLAWFIVCPVLGLAVIAALYALYVAPTVAWMMIAAGGGVVVGIAVVETLESRRRWVQHAGRRRMCKCYYEAGDSLCSVHPPDDAELSYAKSIGCPYDVGGR